MLPLGSFARKDLTSCLPCSAATATCRDFGSFPGGKLMRGETPEDAVRRELMEELQVKVTNLRDFYTVEYDYPDFHLSMECYYCSLADESDEPQKHDRQLDIRWIPRTSLATVEWMPADKGLIDALIELKEDRLEASSADDAAPNTADKPATKPKRAPKRRSKKRPKPGLLDGIDTSDLSADERELVRRRAAIKKSMKGNKRANTKPELLVRQRLRAAGLTGYRLEWKVPGKPDIAFPGRKIAIFVNGCFWHRCPKCNPSQPKRNVEFWEAKFRRNVERDRAAVGSAHPNGLDAHNHLGMRTQKGPHRRHDGKGHRAGACRGTATLTASIHTLRTSAPHPRHKP